MRYLLFYVLLCCALAVQASGRVIRIGPDAPLQLPSQAAAVAQDGDIIEIAAGDYPGDVATWKANKLTLRGVDGMAHIDAAGKNAQGKAIWVIQGKETTVENISFSGCKVPDKNGAGIRAEGAGLTVRHCLFADNENGILAGANAQSDIIVENSEFNHNGAGDGYSHNIYIGQVRSFTMCFCYSHDAFIGHQLKSRALLNDIRYNYLADGSSGQSSYLAQFPNGGQTFLIGNVIQQGPKAENSTAVSYADEGAKNPLQECYIVNNTFINQRQNGKFIRIAGDKPTVKLINNLFTGSNNILTGPGEQLTNLLSETPGFVDAAKGDYHLTATSPARGAGTTTLEKIGEVVLLPEFAYLSPLKSTERKTGEKMDVGAFGYEE